MVHFKIGVSLVCRPCIIGISSINKKRHWTARRGHRLNSSWKRNVRNARMRLNTNEWKAKSWLNLRGPVAESVRRKIKIEKTFNSRTVRNVVGKNKPTRLYIRRYTYDMCMYTRDDNVYNMVTSGTMLGVVVATDERIAAVRMKIMYICIGL